jgi:hypothetical protein
MMSSPTTGSRVAEDAYNQAQGLLKAFEDGATELMKHIPDDQRIGSLSSPKVEDEAQSWIPRGAKSLSQHPMAKCPE